ncbi:uncharacterized protein LOC124320405 [Daphnia pulicaria]|uniref:uncharacterized protein LOC124320405 n=1 Tax=Daphnia pulicaria TaxID=35523 RepID=UPI001EEB9DE0|nr:uncharacterized protein LOC124320405 [Daphnia pulicaria]
MAMALIQFCCCWSTLRSGCYASALYTMIYFTVTITMVTIFGVAEGDPESAGYGELPSSTSPTTDPVEDLETLKILNICVVTLSALGLVSTFFLFYGLAKNRSPFLLPWVVIVSCTTAVDLIYAIYLLIHMESLNPISAMIFTSDFVLVIVNVYCILCVISQFQELNRNPSLEGQIEGLAVTGDFETNHSNNQPPMEEIKLSEVVAGADLRQCRPQLDAVCAENLWIGCQHPDNPQQQQQRMPPQARPDIWLDTDDANQQQQPDNSQQRRVTFKCRPTVSSS